MVGQPEKQKQPEKKSSPLLGAAALAKSPEFTRWTLDPNEVIHQIDTWLKGAKVVLDDKGRAFLVPDPNNERLNEEGRRLVLTPLQALLHKNVVLSNFTDQKIGDHAENFHIKVGSTLFRNWRKVGVTSPQDLPEIINWISFNVYAALNRARDGETWKQLNKLHVVQEQVQHKDKGTSGGLTAIGSMFGRGQ